MRLTQPCFLALPPRPRRILLRSPPPRSPIGAGLATHQPRTAFRPLRTATDCVVKVVEACYLKAPDPRVRIRLLGRVLVIVRSVVVIACRVGRCEILERAELGQVCPCFSASSSRGLVRHLYPCHTSHHLSPLLPLHHIEDTDQSSSISIQSECRTKCSVSTFGFCAHPPKAPESFLPERN